MSILQIRGLTVRFGGLTAVNKVDIAVRSGEIFSIIGPNGAGKTTLFNAVTGVYEPTAGDVLFEGKTLRQPFGLVSALGIVAAALCIGILAVLVGQLESLWEATIEMNYVYLEPFPWRKAWADLGRQLWDNFPVTLWSFVIGAAIGCSGAAVFWRRQRRTPNSVARRGICRTFQNIRLFPDMTVLENVLVGMETRLRARLWHVVLRLPRHYRDERAARERGRELLEFVGLAHRAGELAKNLAYGEQRRLEIARALATRPRMLLLDEPAAGMNPSETVALMGLIRAIRDQGITIALIEHHMRVVMGISDRIAVLDYGCKIAEGTPDEVRCDSRVIEAYLGKEELG